MEEQVKKRDLIDSVNEGIRFLEGYLERGSALTAQGSKALTLSDTENPAKQSANELQKQVATNARANMAQNPLINAGFDTANQLITTVVQQHVGDVFRKNNFSAHERAVQTFFQGWAQISTGGVEVALEAARNSGNNILTLVATKRELIGKIQTTLAKLHNTCVALLNSSPFFDAYLRDLIEAHALIRGSNVKLTDIVRVLDRQNRYQPRKFEAALSDLRKAQERLLPDRGVDVRDMWETSDYVSENLGATALPKALAAVEGIYLLTRDLGGQMVLYAQHTEDINLRLNWFVDALSAFISMFQGNPTFNKLTADHIRTGQTQLQDLLNQMTAVLYPGNRPELTFSNGEFGIEQRPIIDTTGPLYPTQVASYATFWGIRLQVIIDWLELNPGKGAEIIKQTQDAAAAHARAVEDINKQGDITYAGGRLKVERSREDSEGALSLIARLMVVVNTIVLSRTTRGSITSRFGVIRRHFDASTKLLSSIENSIRPFIAAQSRSTSPVRGLLSGMFESANSLGFDRAAGFLVDGRVRDLFSMNSDEVTYEGAAVVGMNRVIAALYDSPDIDEALLERIENLRDTVNREKRTKELESGRFYDSTIDASHEALKRKLAKQEAIIKPAIEAAKTLDSEITDSQTAAAERQMANAIPGFAANNRYLS